MSFPNRNTSESSGVGGRASGRRFGGVLHDPRVSHYSLDGKSVHWVVLQKSVDQVSAALTHMSWVGELNLKRNTCGMRMYAWMNE